MLKQGWVRALALGLVFGALASCVHTREPECGSLGLGCCGGTACNAGLVCANSFCRAQPESCGNPNQPCCNGTACNPGAFCSGATCRAGVCGGNDEPCCANGACSPGFKCQGGSCKADVCGGVGQQCCGGTTCGAGAQCVNGSCAPCSPGVGQSCGHCGGTTQCNGSCTKATPSDFATVKEFSSDEEAFACCFIDYTKTFGGTCTPGWVFEDVTVTKTSGGGSCLVLNQGSGSNCSVTVRFHNNGLEGARCRIAIKQRRVCDTGG